MKRIVLLLVFFQLLGASERPAAGAIIDNFPAVNQRAIPGARDRCGTVALGSWLVWLTEQGKITLPSPPEAPTLGGLDLSGLPTIQKNVLARLDALAGGNEEIMILKLIESLIQYHEEHSEASSRLQIAYYNLLDETYLRHLQQTGNPVLLFHGIYRKDSDSGQLLRVKGHYTCLVGQTDTQLIASTYGKNYSFNLADLPMERIAPQDRYRSSSNESYIYLRCPKRAYPRFNFKTLAPKDPEMAKLQLDEGGQIFAAEDEVILLEGVVVFSCDPCVTEGHAGQG